MASPCEILISSDNPDFLHQIARQVINEVRRFEAKFSRYQANNWCWQLNHCAGKTIALDSETFALLSYAQQLYQLSAGFFDISSGLLRKLWQFKPGATPPKQKDIEALLPWIGFNKIHFDAQYFSMPAEMEIDFGGIGKEYCVDLVVQLLDKLCRPLAHNFLVNFGGDLCARQLNPTPSNWRIGLEAVTGENGIERLIELNDGAIATSGNTKRYFEFEGKRYAHILNPKTGYPIEGAPRSVSVFAQSCSLAGGMASLAQLQGANAEIFLQQNQVKFICVW